MKLPRSGADDDTCYILGSGASLCDLSAPQREYLSSHPFVLGMNKFVIFQHLIGIWPSGAFLHDAHFPSHRVFAETIGRLRKAPRRVHFYVNELYRHYFSFHPRALRRRVGEMRALYRKHAFIMPFVLPYRPVTFFRAGFVNDPDQPFAETLDESLFFYRGSLTTAINLAAIVYPTSRICLVGVDLAGGAYFYESAMRKRSELHDRYFGFVERQRPHPTVQKIDGVPGLMAVMPKVVAALGAMGKTLVCCNAGSLLVTEGVCAQASVPAEC